MDEKDIVNKDNARNIAYTHQLNKHLYTAEKKVGEAWIHRMITRQGTDDQNGRSYRAR